MRIWAAFESLWRDLRFGLRYFRKSPTFSVVAIGTLALGIGASTTVFTIVSAVILRPLPYPDPDQLVSLNEKTERVPDLAISYLDFLDAQKESPSFQGMAAYRDEGANLLAPGEPEFVQAKYISAGFFAVLGVNLARGREFLPDEDRAGATPVAIISHEVWQRRFGEANDAVGRKLTLTGKLYSIVGVLPHNFKLFGFRGPDVMVPIGQNDHVILNRRTVHPAIQVVSRLKQGVTLEQARSELDVIGRRLALEFPDSNAGESIVATPLKQQMLGDITKTLLILSGAVGFVLLIASANVANVLLARSIARKHEFAVRVTLGAGRGRILRQLLTESTLLGLVGGVGGLLLAVAGTRTALRYLSPSFPRVHEIVPDARVVFFALAASLATSLLFGLAPAVLQWSILGEIRGAQRATARGVQRTQAGLLITEVALTLALLVGAGLMLRTILKLVSVDPGFDSHHVARMRVGLSPDVAKDPARIRAAWLQILQKVSAVPGVQSASICGVIPLSGIYYKLDYWTTPAPPAPNQRPQALLYTPSPDYLRTMKIPLLRGRFFTEQDRLGKEPVGVIDDLMAARAFPHQEAVGSKLTVELFGSMVVVGVVGHVKQWGLDEGSGATEEVYLPFLQMPDSTMPSAVNAMKLLVRTSGSPLAIAPAQRESILGPGRDQPMHDLQNLDDMIGEGFADRHLLLVLLSAFAGAALLLSSIGIYGVISYSINQRIQEIGIRMALGARPADIRRMVVIRSMSMVLVGVAVGTCASFPLARLIKSLLYGVEPSDPLTLGVVVLLLGLVAFAASVIPARRAASVDPMVALRHE